MEGLFNDKIVQQFSMRAARSPIILTHLTTHSDERGGMLFNERRRLRKSQRNK